MRRDHRPLPLSPPVELRNVWHRFSDSGQDWTLRGIDLELSEGELVGLLGPSGCGKTTLLRLIAGFERPIRGSVHLQQQHVAGDGRWVSPERRGVGMVFQDYALFPHLTTWENACFGLRAGEERSRAHWLLELLELKHLNQRFPHQLSGGQRQRLALARALAPSPKVVLLDEPFSNLDVEVRLKLRSELPSVLRVCGASGMIVTHDPGEALAICDRVAVMKDGTLHQCDSPRQLVCDPATPFVGRFVLQGNLLPIFSRNDQSLSCVLGDLVAPSVPSAPQLSADSCLLVDPAAISLQLDPEGQGCVMGREFVGNGWQYRIKIESLIVRVNLPLNEDYPTGTRGGIRLRHGSTAILYPSGIRMHASGPCDDATQRAPQQIPPA